MEKFDYYKNSVSYARQIMDLVPVNDKLGHEKRVIRTVYNNILNDYNEEQIREIVILGALFENKLSNISSNIKTELIENLYTTYVKGMVYNYVNGN